MREPTQEHDEHRSMADVLQADAAGEFSDSRSDSEDEVPRGEDWTETVR